MNANPITQPSDIQPPKRTPVAIIKAPIKVGDKCFFTIPDGPRIEFEVTGISKTSQLIQVRSVCKQYRSQMTKAKWRKQLAVTKGL